MPARRRGIERVHSGRCVCGEGDGRRSGWIRPAGPTRMTVRRPCGSPRAHDRVPTGWSAPVRPQDVPGRRISELGDAEGGVGSVHLAVLTDRVNRQLLPLRVPPCLAKRDPWEVHSRNNRLLEPGSRRSWWPSGSTHPRWRPHRQPAPRCTVSGDAPRSGGAQWPATGLESHLSRRYIEQGPCVSRPLTGEIVGDEGAAHEQRELVVVVDDRVVVEGDLGRRTLFRPAQVDRPGLSSTNGRRPGGGSCRGGPRGVGDRTRPP